MTTISQNGWPVLTDPPPAAAIPYTDIRVRVRDGAAATVLLELASRFDREVESLHLPGPDDEWGWNYRPVRGQNLIWSNHASATALDLNASRHPRGRRNTFTSGQVDAIRGIIRDLRDPATGRPVVKWGGDFTTVPDEMHFEIAGDLAAVTRAAQLIERRHRAAEESTGDYEMRLNLTPDGRWWIYGVAGKRYIDSPQKLAEWRKLGLPEDHLSSTVMNDLPTLRG